MNSIVHLNGWPGSGKRTIGSFLAPLIGARLLDCHVMLNPAEALFEREDPLHAQMRYAVRLLTFNYAAKLSPGTSVILTDPLSNDIADAAVYEQYRALAVERNARLISILLEITAEENARRLQTPSRAEHQKLTRPDVLTRVRDCNKLLRLTDTDSMTLDVTNMPAAEAAARIVEWIRRA